MRAVDSAAFRQVLSYPTETVIKKIDGLCLAREFPREHSFVNNVKLNQSNFNNVCIIAYSGDKSTI